MLLRLKEVRYFDSLFELYDSVETIVIPFYNEIKLKIINKVENERSKNVTY